MGVAAELRGLFCIGSVAFRPLGVNLNLAGVLMFSHQLFGSYVQIHAGIFCP